jgi:hypothetical protein
LPRNGKKGRVERILSEGMADIEGLSASATEMDELPKKLCHFEETPCLTRYASFCLAYHFVGSGVIEFGRTLMRQRLKFVVRFENSREAAA